MVDKINNDNSEPLSTVSGDSNSEGSKANNPADFLHSKLPDESETQVYQQGEATATPNDEVSGSGSPGNPDTSNSANNDQFAQDEQARKRAEYRGMLDEKGKQFDPSIHLEPPELTPTGRWKRIPKAKRESMANNEEQIEANINYRKEAQKSALIYATLHAIPFPGDSKPQPEVFNGLVDSIERYYMEKCIKESPVEIDLIMSMGIYTQNIVTRPSNWEKTKRFFSGAWGRFKYARDKQKQRTGLAYQEEIRARAEKKEDPPKRDANTIDMFSGPKRPQ